MIGVLVFSITSVGFAGYELSQNDQPQVINIEKVEFSGPVTFNGVMPEMISEDAEFGGTSHMKSDVIATGAWTFTDDVSISNPDATYQFDLNFQQPTTTSGVAAQATQLLLGTQVISGNMLCNMASADLTATGIFGYDFRLGTSTTATSSDAHLIADTHVNTSTDDILNKEDDEGTSTGEVWAVSDGEYFTAMITFDVANVTSSDSLLAKGGNAGAGTVHINCWNSD